jgi:hypothetical protein
MRRTLPAANGEGPSTQQGDREITSNDATSSDGSTGIDRPNSRLVAALIAHCSQYGPGPGRGRWVQVIHRCPACAHMHLHRSVQPVESGAVRTGPCGMRYQLRLANAPRIPRQRAADQLAFGEVAG